MPEHYDEMNLLLYLEGQLESERAREISVHAGACRECGALLRSLQHEGLWLRESLTDADEAIPARVLEPPLRSSMRWGWMISIGLGAAGVYGLWSGIVEPWQDRFSQAGFTQGNLLSMLFFSGALWKGWGDMRNLVEILATVAVMLIFAMLLRHNWRRWTAIGVVMGALLFSLAGAPAAMAGKHIKGQPNYTLPAGQTINTDVFVAGDSMRFDGDVNGDLFVFGHSVVVNGHVTGDVLGFTQTMTINGRVDGNIRTWSQTLTILGSVGKNLLGGADSIEIDPKGSVGGSVTAFADEIMLNGPVGRDVMAHAKNFSTNGKVGGDMNLSARNISIGPQSVIAGGITYSGDKTPEIDPGAKISGAVEGKHVEYVPSYKKPRYYWHLALTWAASFLFGMVVILMIPAFFNDVMRALDQPGTSGGAGILAVAGVPFAAVIACITIVGLAVGLTTILLYIIGLYSAHVFVGAWLGRKILGDVSASGPMLGRMALGLAILTVVKLIPWIGAIVALVVLVWGAGGIAVTVYRRMRPVLATA